MMRSGGLFAGYGGLDMAIAEVFGSEPAWFSEIDNAPSRILAHHWPTVPNLGDITQINWDTVDPVAILGGGFPCQDVSLAGARAGMNSATRSGLWAHFAIGISKLRPRYVVVENVRGLLSAEAHSDVEPCPWCLGDGPSEPALRALGAVLADLADLGYDAQWCGLRAADVGAPHGRYRIFVLARDTNRSDRDRRPSPGLAWETRPAIGSTADASGKRHGDGGTQGERGIQTATFPGSAPHAGDNGRERGAQRDLGPQGRVATSLREDADGRGDFVADSHGDPLREQPVAKSRRSGQTVAGLAGSNPARSGASAALWGQYTGAINRWELTVGRPAPAPTEPTTKGSQRLSPQFVEWMMGLSAGHVTDVPGVNRNAQLKALGNGVVPQQAAAALRHMLANQPLLQTA